ncbi:MAG: cation:proton antiporter, partial [Alphaproteobacteria bacterium]|nr:cation:proton antiporter [Alphaproteobacteria bacterium]
GHGSLDWWSLARTVIGIAVFMTFSFTVGRRIVFALIRWTNDNFRSEFPVITMILIIMGVMAEMTQLLGVHTVLGAFVAGILVGESPILTRHVEDQLRGLITALFMPVFFGLAGLTADLTVLANPTLLLLTGGLVLIASVGKFTGAFLGGEMGGLHVRQSIAVGSAMNARGSTEVIVASIGLAMGALSHNLYTMIVTMAVLTTLAMPPMLRRVLAALPMGEEEQTRVEREALDARGFVPNLERLLLSVDDSAPGKLVSRIAGLIAGAYGMPITIVRVKEDETETEEPPDGASRQVKEGAKKAQKVMVEDQAEPDPEKVQITSRVAAEEAPKAIGEESRKGFDLMMIGLENSYDKGGVFNEQTTRIAKEFNGSIALLAVPDGILPAVNSRVRLVVPVNGTPASRHAAEIACVIARPTGARVHALFVSAGTAAYRGGARASRAQEEAVLKDIADLGERYDVNLTTSLQPHGEAEAAILRAANDHTLIVMGVTQRPGDQLFFGNTATALLTKSKVPIFFIATAAT